MDIELLGLVNVLADTFQDHHLQEPLENSLLGGRKYPGCRIADNPQRLAAILWVLQNGIGNLPGIGSPGLGLCDGQDILPMGNLRKNLEGLGKRPRLVARKNHANPAKRVLLVICDESNRNK